MGPTLFIIYVNELPTIVQSQIKLFADDTKIYRPIQTIEDTETLQQDLITLGHWSSDWLLKFNAEKCKIMHCGSGNPKVDYVMTGTDGVARVLQETAAEKDLGVHITNTLKPTFHCQKAANKATSALRLLRLSFDRIDCHNFKTLYTVYVRPHLDYCSQAVGPYMVQDFDLLEKVQRRATKLVEGFKHLPYQERLLRLKLPSMKERVLRGDMIETYKILTGKINTDPNHFFEMSNDDRTRGHTMKLKKRRSDHQARNKFFSNRVVNTWNHLPDEVVTARTTNAFKNRLDQHWAASPPLHPT